MDCAGSQKIFLQILSQDAVCAENKNSLNKVPVHANFPCERMSGFVF
jgi:hypothetical protein